MGFINSTIIIAQTFPVIAGVNSSEETSQVMSHTVALPPDIQSGDLLIIFWTDENNSSTLNVPIGWISLYNIVSNNERRAAYYKPATGSEGTSVAFTTTNSERSAHTSYRILANTYQGVPYDTSSTGNSNSPDPPELMPSWGSYKTLWIAASHSEGDLGGAVPNGYGDLVVGFTEGEGVNHAKMMTTTRFLEIDVEDPNEFSLSDVRRWSAATVAIQGKNVIPPFAPVLRLMPLGDSIVRGFTGSSSNIGGAGYRKVLIDLLESFGYQVSISPGRDFNFVGSDITGTSGFDMDNEGHSGFHAFSSSSTVSMFHNLTSYIIDNPPDIILLHIGTNDIDAGNNAATVVGEVEDLLDIIDDFDSGIVVILAKIINRTGPGSLVTITDTFNAALQTMAEQRISNGDKLFLVDAGTDFTYVEDQIDPFVGDMWDELHPNDSGYTKIAKVWFEKLKEVLTPVLASPPDGSINQPANLTFTWNAATGAGSYHLQIATDSDFNTIFYQDSSITGTSAIAVLDSNVQYYWRVRAKINTGVSPFSSVRSLTTVLPVELSTFNAVIKNKTAELFWRTETEVNNLGFEIQRADINPKFEIRNPQFKKIGFVEGNGNSNSPKEYSFVDDNLFGSNKFIYRLKQIDTDGTFAYSDEVEINIFPDKFELSQNYPNPFNPSTSIEFRIPYTTTVRIDVYDILGQLVQTLINKELETGNHKVTFDAANLPGGTYFYRILSGNFSDTKKMLLVK